jgi:hypothetical protein
MVGSLAHTWDMARCQLFGRRVRWHSLQHSSFNVDETNGTDLIFVKAGLADKDHAEF